MGCRQNKNITKNKDNDDMKRGVGKFIQGNKNKIKEKKSGKKCYKKGLKKPFEKSLSEKGGTE